MSVIIIGGGIIGGAIAHYAGKAGIKDITLLEKEKLLGTGATQYCSGGVRYQFSTPINVKFSIAAFPELETYDIGMHRFGYLILDMASDSMPRVKMQNDLGVKSEYLTPAQLKERFPYVNAEGVISASFHKLDGIAEPAKLMEIYEKGAKAGGVKIMTETTVKKILKEGGKVVGVETNKGIMKADKVILAAGPQSMEVAKTCGVDLTIVKRRKYILAITGFDFDFPVTLEVPTGWYIKKEGTDALIGMSGKEEKVDFEKKEESVDETLNASLLRFPLTENSSIKKVNSTMSDETPDKHAVIDGSVPGLIIATGFSGHGFMHSPAVGKTVASMIKGEKPALDVSELKLHRSHIKEPIAI